MLTFGEALAILKRGGRVARAGWNGKGMWLALVQPHPADYETSTNALLECTYLVRRATTETINNDMRISRWLRGAELAPWIGMHTADARFVPWLASQTDMLAEDWSEIT